MKRPSHNLSGGYSVRCGKATDKKVHPAGAERVAKGMSATREVADRLNPSLVRR